jgi:hypothetical protein
MDRQSAACSTPAIFALFVRIHSFEFAVFHYCILTGDGAHHTFSGCPWTRTSAHCFNADSYTHAQNPAGNLSQSVVEWMNSLLLQMWFTRAVILSHLGLYRQAAEELDSFGLQLRHIFGFLIKKIVSRL